MTYQKQFAVRDSKSIYITLVHEFHVIELRIRNIIDYYWTVFIFVFCAVPMLASSQFPPYLLIRGKERNSVCTVDFNWERGGPEGKGGIYPQ